MVKHLLLTTALALGAVSPAFAHTGYLLPNRFFLTEAGTITTQAAFSETFPLPEIALRSPSMGLVMPTGETIAFDEQQTIGAMTVLAAKLTETGTYRLTTGKRLGRKGYVIDDGTTLSRATSKPDPDKLADGSKILTSQTVTVSDAYVSIGEVSAVQPEALSRLTIGLGTHPSCILDRQGLVLDIDFDGAPLAHHDVTISRPFGPYLGEGEGLDYKTDAAGKLTFATFPAGIYMIMVRHLDYAPEGSETDVQSYTTSLVLDVQGRGGYRKGCES